MLNLRAHHTLCLVIPESYTFRLRAKLLLREKGYTDKYIDAYMNVFEAARKNKNEKIKFLNSPKDDETCMHCHNYEEDRCISPQASIFAEWDGEILKLLGLNLESVVTVASLKRLIYEKINPLNMPCVCKNCIFDLIEICKEILMRVLDD